MLQVVRSSIQTQHENHTFQMPHLEKKGPDTQRYQVVWKEKQDVNWARVNPSGAICVQRVSP